MKRGIFSSLLQLTLLRFRRTQFGVIYRGKLLGEAAFGKKCQPAFILAISPAGAVEWKNQETAQTQVKFK